MAAIAPADVSTGPPAGASKSHGGAARGGAWSDPPVGKRLPLAHHTVGRCHRSPQQSPRLGSGPSRGTGEALRGGVDLPRLPGGRVDPRRLKDRPVRSLQRRERPSRVPRADLGPDVGREQRCRRTDRIDVGDRMTGRPAQVVLGHRQGAAGEQRRLQARGDPRRLTTPGLAGPRVEMTRVPARVGVEAAHVHVVRHHRSERRPTDGHTADLGERLRPCREPGRPVVRTSGLPPAAVVGPDRVPAFRQALARPGASAQEENEGLVQVAGHLGDPPPRSPHPASVDNRWTGPRGADHAGGQHTTEERDMKRPQG